jgi:hypothetical protein
MKNEEIGAKDLKIQLIEQQLKSIVLNMPDNSSEIEDLRNSQSIYQNKIYALEQELSELHEEKIRSQASQEQLSNSPKKLYYSKAGAEASSQSLDRNLNLNVNTELLVERLQLCIRFLFAENSRLKYRRNAIQAFNLFHPCDPVMRKFKEKNLNPAFLQYDLKKKSIEEDMVKCLSEATRFESDPSVVNIAKAETKWTPMSQNAKYQVSSRVLTRKILFQKLDSLKSALESHNNLSINAI